MLLLLATIAHAACPATPVELTAGITAVERAFAALDADGVAEGGTRLGLATACLDTVIAPAVAVRLHAAQGLVAFVAGDADDATAAFAAARRIDPSWQPDPALVPKGHPIRGLATRLDPTTLGTERVPSAAAGTLSFDGEAGLDRPVGTPTVAQWVKDSTVVSGAYVWPDATLPPYDVGTSARTADRAPPKALGAWLVVGGVGLAASATSFYVADRARSAWEEATTGAEVQTHLRENHVSFAAGATFGVIAAVGGIGALASVAF